MWGDLAEYDPDIFADVLRSSAEIAAEEIDPNIYIEKIINFLSNGGDVDVSN